MRVLQSVAGSPTCCRRQSLDLRFMPFWQLYSGSTTCHPRPLRVPATEKVLENPSLPAALSPVLLRSVFLALGIWAAWTAAASDPTLPLGACLAFAAWKIYDKRSKRSPGGWAVWLAPVVAAAACRLCRKRSPDGRAAVLGTVAGFLTAVTACRWSSKRSSKCPGITSPHLRSMGAPAASRALITAP